MARRNRRCQPASASDALEDRRGFASWCLLMLTVVGCGRLRKRGADAGPRVRSKLPAVATADPMATSSNPTASARRRRLGEARRQTDRHTRTMAATKPMVERSPSPMPARIEAHLGTPGRSGSYKMCQISNGQVFLVWQLVSGKAVVNKDGSYQHCDISNGQIFSCWRLVPGQSRREEGTLLRAVRHLEWADILVGSWYQGQTVAYTPD